jgi:hypothetical protein
VNVIDRWLGRASKGWISKLSDKWHQIPTAQSDRASSIDQLRLPDPEFIAWWESIETDYFSVPRTCWPIEVYRHYFAGHKVIEVGPGAGVHGINFLRAGAAVTFIDVARPNLDLIERVCRLKNVAGADFLHLTDFVDPLKLAPDYDAIYACGSLHHTPSEVSKPEFEALASRLKIGGRFIALTYPRERWQREGSKPFSEWGKGTDGERTPWAEWYDEAKMHAQLAPYRFRTLMAFNYHNDDFNWFDLQRVA